MNGDSGKERGNPPPTPIFQADFSESVRGEGSLKQMPFPSHSEGHMLVWITGTELWVFREKKKNPINQSLYSGDAGEYQK